MNVMTRKSERQVLEHHAGTTMASGPKNKKEKSADEEKPRGKATVMCSALNVRAGAGVHMPRIGLLRKGQTVVYYEAKDGWLRIQHNSSSDAWISAQYTTYGQQQADPQGPGGAVSPEGVPLYSQLDPQWDERILGRGATVHRFGCALTSTAMVLSKYAGREITPAELDEYLDKNNGYYGDAIIWDAAAKYVGCAHEGKRGGYTREECDELLDHGHAFVIGVNGNYHWVCVAGRHADGSYIIHDPEGGIVLNGYWNTETKCIEVDGYFPGDEIHKFY